jgi:hypothetical protein
MKWAAALGLALAFLAGKARAKDEPGKEKSMERIGFEEVEPGKLPEGWKVEGTNQKGPLATWEAAEDSSAPEGKKTLRLTRPNHDTGGTFNLCWNPSIRFKDGSLSAMLRADSGKVDQGGGLIWRTKDKDNYYICRANPLEDNLRLYHVKDGKRKQIGNADLKIPSGQWHKLEIRHKGDRIACALNGKTLLEIEDDTFPGEGGVGFWTKADAATSFDKLEIEAAP